MTTTDTNQIEEMAMHNAQLYWDGGDINNQGWVLTYRNESGTEQSIEIEGDRDATLAELASAVDDERHWIGTGKIKVLRGANGEGGTKGTLVVHGDGVAYNAS